MKLDRFESNVKLSFVIGGVFDKFELTTRKNFPQASQEMFSILDYNFWWMNFLLPGILAIKAKVSREITKDSACQIFFGIICQNLPSFCC